MQPRCLASTGRTFCKSIRDQHDRSLHFRGRDDGSESNVFREAQFTADATAIVTHNEDQRLRTFILPPDATDGVETPALLEPYAQFQSASNIQSYATYPYFSLHDAALSVVLCASAAVPIAMRNAADYSIVHAKYPLVDARTEQHLSAHSLAFTRAGTHFVAGADGRLVVFDCYRDGGHPLTTHRLHFGRRKARATGGWRMCRGVVLALSISCDGILAVGTSAGEVALFEAEGFGECIAVFAATVDLFAGSGITDLKWSPCGRYLLIAERRSDAVQVFDVRGSGTAFATLQGRNADTPQRLGIDVVPTAGSFDVWAGGRDGCVRTWRSPASSAGQLDSDDCIDMHKSPVSSLARNHDQSLLVTCSGERFDIASTVSSPGDDQSIDPSDQADNSLKLWRLPD